MNEMDFILFFVGVLLGISIPRAVSGAKSIVQDRSANKRIEFSLMRLDAELKGIKTLISMEKNAEAQLLNEALEKDFGSPDQVK